MTPLEHQDLYETKRDSFKNEAGDGTTTADSDLVVVEVQHMAQVTNLRITGATTELFDLVVRDQDEANPSTEQSFVTSDINDGSFESPAFKSIGAQKEVAIINRSALADDNYAVNIEVDQHRRGAEG